jgi:glycosyltransferase involved in cell wall biosynthesis
MDSSLLSILVPLYNEEQFVAESLERVLRAPLPDGMDREIIVVDDGSTDKSAGIVAALCATRPKIRLIRHDRNRGKGAAIRTAIGYAQGDYCIVQDADLEYDPSEYMKLLHPLVAGRADVVYGSRFLVAGERRVLYFWHSVANWMLTLLCNIVSDVNLSDMETCYKAFRTPLLKSIPLRCNRFGIEPEVTIKVARRKARMYEVPVSYYGRTYEDGKKIGLIDAFQAVWVILRFAFTQDLHKDPETKTLPAVVDIPTQP